MSTFNKAERDLANAGKPIHAIKMHRERTGVSLKEAVEAERSSLTMQNEEIERRLRLERAAPALLEALKSAHLQLKLLGRESDDLHSAVMSQVRAAIKRAEEG